MIANDARHLIEVQGRRLCTQKCVQCLTEKGFLAVKMQFYSFSSFDNMIFCTFYPIFLDRSNGF